MEVYILFFCTLREMLIIPGTETGAVNENSVVTVELDVVLDVCNYYCSRSIWLH